MNAKKSLRVSLNQELERLSEVEKIAKSKLISQNLFQKLRKFKAGELGVYAPMKNEVHWNSEFDQNASYLFSRFDENGKMDFYPSRFSELEKVKIWNKDCSMPKLLGIPQIPKAILVPGLGFTREGERLGRGKGFFDRYLENFKGLKIGICFKVQLISVLPSLSHDAKMDWIVTEEESIECVKKC